MDTNVGISFKQLLELAKAMPKCSITPPKDAGTSWIIDSNGEKVGSLQFHTGVVTIFTSYEHCDHVINALGKEKFKDISEKNFDMNPPDTVEFNDDGEPEMTDYGKQLYEQRGENEELSDHVQKLLDQL